MRKPEWLRKTEAIFGTQGVEKVAEYCRENWQEDTAHVIRAAEDALREYVFYLISGGIWSGHGSRCILRMRSTGIWSPGGIRSSCGSSTGTGSCSALPRLTG